MVSNNTVVGVLTRITAYLYIFPSIFNGLQSQRAVFDKNKGTVTEDDMARTRAQLAVISFMRLTRPSRLLMLKTICCSCCLVADYGNQLFRISSGIIFSMKGKPIAGRGNKTAQKRWWSWDLSPIPKGHPWRLLKTNSNDYFIRINIWKAITNKVFNPESNVSLVSYTSLIFIVDVKHRDIRSVETER